MNGDQNTTVETPVCAHEIFCFEAKRHTVPGTPQPHVGSSQAGQDKHTLPHSETADFCLPHSAVSLRLFGAGVRKGLGAPG